MQRSRHQPTARSIRLGIGPVPGIPTGQCAVLRFVSLTQLHAPRLNFDLSRGAHSSRAIRGRDPINAAIETAQLIIGTGREKQGICGLLVVTISKGNAP